MAKRRDSLVYVEFDFLQKQQNIKTKTKTIIRQPPKTP